MGKYILQRLTLTIPTVIGLTIIVFLFIRLLPGDVIDAMSGTEVALDPARRMAMLKELGLADPLYTQYFRWVGQVFSGDLGRSLRTGLPLRSLFLNALPVTLELGLLASIIATLTGIPLGMFSALKRDSATDFLARILGLIGLSLPNFWLATLTLLVTSIYLRWVPGLFWISPLKDPLGNLKQMILPAVCLSFQLMAIIMRMTRATMLETLRQDYISVARAKGLEESKILWRHALRNALIPIVTIAGVQMGYLLSGSVVIEQIFSLPGIGWFFLRGLFDRDYPVIQIMALFLAVVFVAINLVTDVVYAYIDPRIRLDRER